MKLKKLFIILLLLIVIAAAGAGYYLYSNRSVDTSEYIGPDQALAIALEDIGTSDDLVYDTNVELQFTPHAVYSVRFTSVSTHYVYGIDAMSGQILLTGVTE